MTNASAWFALGGVLGGAVLTGAMAFLKAHFDHKWSEEDRIATQHEQESRTMRDQRREVCHDYLVKTNSFRQAINQLHDMVGRGADVNADEHTRSAHLAEQDAYVYLTISCGAAVRELARQYNSKLWDLWQAAQGPDQDAWNETNGESYEARRRVREAMRRELGVSD